MSKRVAIMQPYFFPYIGYYQMVYNSDIFISYNSVDYIQRGWIHRNKLFINGNEKYFTLSIEKAPIKTPIKNIKLKNYSQWKNNFLQLIEFSYKKAPYFYSTYEFLSILLNNDFELLDELLDSSLNACLNYFEYKGKIIKSSDLPIDITNLEKEKKLEKIMEHLSAREIILPPGSVKLYEKWSPPFIKKTLSPPNIEYIHFKHKKVKNYSIIDMMMFLSKQQLIEILKSPNFTTNE
jgi:hypothetical protein